jgi:beta propeller repeat protein
MIEMKHMRVWVTMMALALSSVGCDDDASSRGSDAASEASDASELEVGGGDVSDALGPEVAPADTGAGDDGEVVSEVVGPNRVEVGPNACCLTMEGDIVIWSDDGDLYMWDATTNVRSLVVGGPGMQKDPVLAGGRLVWADNRSGNFDLWTMQLWPERGEPRLLRGGPGDQDQPVMDGTRLVWIGRDLPPHTAREAEVFTLDLAIEGSERQLTSDGYEQTHPAVSGHRIVWADFAHSPDAMYIDISDPLRNNADIFGWDLIADRQFIVTEDISKQLRPAIDGETVVWLDWRGINPEPKYSEFQVFGRRLSESGPQAERLLAHSSWSRPELWRRPAIANGLAVFIAEPTAPGSGFVTGLLAVSLEGGSPWLVAGSPSVLESVAVGGGKAAFVGAGAIGRVELRAR